MKIDRSDPRHWWYLLAFAGNVLLALLLRVFLRVNRWQVVLYGHKLNGNLLAIHDEILRRHGSSIDLVVLSLDADYARALRAEGVNVVCAVHLRAARVLANASAIITDHGLHVMEPLLWLTRIRFFDVWHGIPFKGFDADDFRVQRRYDEVWVASPLLAALYVQRFGFDSARVIVTGYARTDRLVHRTEEVAAIRARLGAPATGPLILFAPTWVQDSEGRSLYPFGCSEDEFLIALSSLARRRGGKVLMRAHLNSAVGAGDGYPDVILVPQSRYPDTESVLLVSDVLICDWSSIAFDFLLLDRPAVFLDVAAPFRKGFSLGPEYRYGPVVSSLDDLMVILSQILADPNGCRILHASQREQVSRDVYGEFADGRATARCVDQLTRHLIKGESSR